MTQHQERILLPNDGHKAKLIYTAEELGIVGIRGEWKDIYQWEDGTIEQGQRGEFEWRPNQIQNSFATLLATWLRGESGYSRLGFIGIGSGLVGWDSATPPQPYSQTTLTTEYFRKAIPQADIVYVDPTTGVPTGGTPSPKVEITSTIGSSEANGQSMREFGLFGGTATIALDSGEMVNWVVHDRIDKDSSLTIERIVRIEFVTR